MVHSAAAHDHGDHRQIWAPDAYEGAPAVAAAFIASVSKVASFALLLTIGGQLVGPGPTSGAREAVEQTLRNGYQAWQPLLL
ncbi:MAG TPA: proton-conducting transporter membrane subunit, partial [Terracidiphilus sp.]